MGLQGGPPPHPPPSDGRTLRHPCTGWTRASACVVQVPSSRDSRIQDEGKAQPRWSRKGYRWRRPDQSLASRFPCCQGGRCDRSEDENINVVKRIYSFGRKLVNMSRHHGPTTHFRKKYLDARTAERKALRATIQGSSRTWVHSAPGNLSSCPGRGRR